MVYKLFGEKTGSGKRANVLAEEFHKAFIKKIQKKEMGQLSSKNQDVKYLLLCVIDAFTIYASVKPLKHKKAKTVLHAFIEIISESKLKANKFQEDNCTIVLRKNGYMVIIF